MTNRSGPPAFGDYCIMFFVVAVVIYAVAGLEDATDVRLTRLERVASDTMVQRKALEHQVARCNRLEAGGIRAWFTSMNWCDGLPGYPR